MPCPRPVSRRTDFPEEEKSDIARLKQRLNQEITKYFFKKAEIEGGLVSAPALLDNRPPSLSPPSVLRDAAGQDQHQPPLKRKRGRLKLKRSPDSPTSIPDDELAYQRHYLMPADDEEDDNFQSAFVPAPRKRGRPRLNTETNQDGHSSETQAREPKKRGRKKGFHCTKYGTRLPLACLSAAGTMMNADQLQAQEPDTWTYVVRFILDRQKGAPYRIRTWMEKKSKDCLSSFVDLQKKTRWFAGFEKGRACRECRKSDRPCIILDPTATEMILLPRVDDPEEAA